MELTLTPEEVRVLGCLIEKAYTTPEVYPLTLNSLTLACNQRTNRNPVVDYSEETVTVALDGLREKGLARRVDAAGARTAKFRHVLPDALPLATPQIALLCVLLLRGAQTVGELRARSDRIHTFRDLAEVEATLNSLVHPEAESDLEEPLVAPLPLRPGSRELRFAHLFGPVLPAHEEILEPEQPVAPAIQPRATRAEVEALSEELGTLRRQLDELRAEFDALKAQLS